MDGESVKYWRGERILGRGCPRRGTEDNIKVDVKRDRLGERGVVARFCEHVNELSAFLKYGVFFE